MKPSSSPVPPEIQAENMIMRGILEIPKNARNIVVFAHGSDSSKRSPRNRLVASWLVQRGFAVLLPDLAVDEDEDSPQLPGLDGPNHDVLETARRLTSVIDWLAANSPTCSLRIGLFGGREGAAVAMIAAALRPNQVHAIVSRGGRPDLADEMLQDVQAPTLMIVGSGDHTHIRHNRNAREKMRSKPMLELIHGATHLFCEPGKLEQVASISSLWFQRNLALCG